MLYRPLKLGIAIPQIKLLGSRNVIYIKEDLDNDSSSE
jgi:hypothetical protein